MRRLKWLRITRMPRPHTRLTPILRESPLVYFRVLEECNRRPLTAQCAQSLRQWVVQESPHSYPAYFANHDEVHPLIYHAKH